VCLAEVAQGINQAVLGCKFANGGGLAAGDDESVPPVEVAGQSHFTRHCAEAAESLHVFREIALKGEDTNVHGFFN
jgi:hypothetical protein